MESEAEGARLLRQGEAQPSRARLLRAGVEAGMRVLDAGCGAGAVTRELCELVGPAGRVTALDPSPRLLEEARAALAGHRNVDFVQAALPATGLPGGQFDLAWSHLVFEHLADPAAALGELKRLVRVGGKVVVSDVDGNGLLNWPQPPLVEAGAARMQRALERAGVDLFVGRKLHHLFWHAGLSELRDRVDPAFVVGAADERLLADWRTRLEALTPLALTEFDSPADWDALRREFLGMLADPAVLKYGVFITAEGTRLG
jgi:SAM-dependent methyltransferase